MRIDVVTLFPAWFEWFKQQRHVANALTLGHELGFVDLRASTPLGAGQVDDTPYGGGAGMVSRRAAAGSTTRSPASWPPSPRSRSCAAATRASTSACTSTSPRM